MKSSKRLVRVCLLFLGFTKISWVKVTDFQYREGENGSKATGEPEAGLQLDSTGAADSAIGPIY